MSRYASFCGPSNRSLSIVANCERTVNWYLEAIQSQGAPFDLALYPTPGQSALMTASDVGGRGFLEAGGRSFAVIGGGFYELFPATGLLTRIGAVAQDSNPATLTYNGVTGGQIFITSGGNGYLYVLATGALTTVLTGDATMGGCLSNRFLAFCRSTGRVRMSDQNDGATWGSATVYGFLRGQAPDPWQTMLVVPPEIWLIGTETGEVWYDAGSYPQPFAPVPGALFQSGTPAPFSAAKAGDVVTWVAQSKDGQGTIVAAKGYVPQTISNYAVETALNGFPTLSDAEVLVYEEAGHRFAAYNFPQARSTWVYDFSMNHWHERGSWDAVTGTYDVWSARVHGFLGGKHLVGTRGTTTISELSTRYQDDNGAMIRRLRIPPPIYAEPRKRLCIDRLQVYLESGMGLETGGPSGEGVDPQVMGRFSADAKTWSAERMVSAGPMGEYRRRVVWTRCGSTDTLWVPEITVTDPIAWRLLGAEIN